MAARTAKSIVSKADIKREGVAMWGGKRTGLHLVYGQSGIGFGVNWPLFLLSRTLLGVGLACYRLLAVFVRMETKRSGFLAPFV